MLGIGGYNGPSFFQFLMEEHSHLLPPLTKQEHMPPVREIKAVEGTTVLALKHDNGVLMVGDRMAVEGFQVSSRKIEKIYKADERSAIAIAGAAGPCMEMVKLFQTELQHYEKIEGEKLAIEGKANMLSQMVKLNLSAALYGLVVIPIFAGYDAIKEEGRIFKYDITGGRYEEDDYSATGSGGKDARSSLKKLFRRRLSEEDARRIGLEALFDASEEDLGTGSPDLSRDILPNMINITSRGVQDVPDPTIRETYQTIFEARRI